MSNSFILIFFYNVDWNATATLFAFVFSVLSLYLSIKGHLRDCPKIRVQLLFDQRIPNASHTQFEKYLVALVTNTGRRPIFIKNVFLMLPGETVYPGFEIKIDGTKDFGKTLAEGDRPWELSMFQKTLNLERFQNNWRDIKVIAVDSADNQYISEEVHGTPSWVKNLITN